VDTRHQLSIWYFVFAMVAMLALQSVLFNRHVETLAYSDFKTLLHAGIADLQGAKERARPTACWHDPGVPLLRTTAGTALGARHL
jgi:hypothetical protein